MNQDLQQIVTYYATKPHIELSQLLLNKSKDNLIAYLSDLLTAYMNDKNSSSLREFVTVSIAGYTHSAKKLGYNGYKHTNAIGSIALNCEAKPKNIQTEGYDTRKTKAKLNAEGGFNDYTVKRLEKDVQANLNLLCSGFIDGELQYILEFPFSAIYERLASELTKIKGPYLRSATFNFSHYEQCAYLKVIYSNLNSIKVNAKYFNKKFISYLLAEQSQ
jgi:hypothetical protein